jgi:effector-binding domain-containing protein
MTAYMVVGMGLWMRHRRHDWASVLEMSAAMIVPYVLLVGPFAAGLLAKGASGRSSGRERARFSRLVTAVRPAGLGPLGPGGIGRSGSTMKRKEEDVPAMLVASIRTGASLATVGKEIQEAFARLGEVVGLVGFGDGMPGMITHEMPAEGYDDMDVEIVMPIRERMEPPPGVEVRVLEGGTVASTIHRGRYDQVGRAYEALTAWVPAHGRDFGGPPREFYLNDPHQGGAHGGPIPSPLTPSDAGEETGGASWRR